MWHPRDAGVWLGWGTWASQAAKHSLKTRPGSERAKAAKDKSQRAFNAGGAQPGESGGELLFKELGEAPSGKGSPGEGHLPPRRTQDPVSSAPARTGCQQAGKAVLQEG